MTKLDPFRAKTTIQTPLGDRVIYRLDRLATMGPIDQMPYCVKVLLEAALRNFDGLVVNEQIVKGLAKYDAQSVAPTEIPFKPGRVILQDFTGVPALVDLAAMRVAIRRMTDDPRSAKKVNPLVPCDLVIDHSVQVDTFNTRNALTINSEKEFERNQERYQFLKWGQKAFANFRVVPPATGIVHQVNLEYLAKVVWSTESDVNGPGMLYPDSLVGTDSHTTMINGLGVVGWGVGGIEAEAVMLGQPIYMLMPEVVGFRLTGQLAEGVTATDMVLTITQILRSHGVVDKFVEFFGPGLREMPVANRATIANMAPEYGATIGFFPVDAQTIRYLSLTGRDAALVETVELYCKQQGLWRDDNRTIVYTEELELDLSSIVPSLAGPKRPQDRISLTEMRSKWRHDLDETFGKSSPTPVRAPEKSQQSSTATASQEKQVELVPVQYDSKRFGLQHGAVVIAAITSCTNTSNPHVLIAAGLLARKARQRGLNRQPWVKTSLAPGSQIVTEYLKQAGLMEDLEALGFHLVGYGCTTCIGNSGPLPTPISAAIKEHDLVAAAVLSGNRNFEGRINPDTKANYLASPPLVVAYAIAGTVDIDLTTEPIGQDKSGEDVFLADIWPDPGEINRVVSQCVTREQFVEKYANVFEGAKEWKSVPTIEGDFYEWDKDSTYIQQPPFFVDLAFHPQKIGPIQSARCLVKLGDSVTTDHISPAGSIAKESPAGAYLIGRRVPVSMFNSYGSRRGNDRVMIRGTFANIRVRNQLAPDTEGGFTQYLGAAKLTPDKVCTVFDAAEQYKKDGTPLIVLAGQDYGMGSSRDWAAKGTFLLGIRAVIAQSFERIHRSNLVGTGVLPLCFPDGESAQTLGLDGTEIFDIEIGDDVQPRQSISVIATKGDGTRVNFKTICRIDTPVEVDYYRNDGILHTVLRNMAKVHMSNQATS